VPTAGAELFGEQLTNGNCNAVGGGVGDVAITAIQNAGYLGEYEIGTLRHSKDPLAVVTREDDKQFTSYVFWVMSALFYAEEKGITKENANFMMPVVNLFGPLHRSIFRDAVGAVGSYAEIYDRNVASDIPRGGLNLLNKNLLGPQHYPLPGLP